MDPPTQKDQWHSSDFLLGSFTLIFVSQKKVWNMAALCQFVIYNDNSVLLALQALKTHGDDFVYFECG